MANGGRDIQEVDDKTAAAGRAHESLIAYDSATLWNSYLACKKNPGHFNFIPVRQFGIGHLPFPCRDKRLLSFIKLASRRSVRIVTKLTSADRHSDLLLGNLRGSKALRLGSGFARVSMETSEFPCPIPDCPRSKKKHNVYGYINIITCKHVVYDQPEALHTSAQFFYEDPTNSRGFISAQCVGFDYSMEDNDVAYLRFVTHNPHLCDVLKEEAEELKKVYATIPLSLWEACHDLCVVIGHPHGMSKTISLGKHLSFEVCRTSARAHYHNGPTCAGSSGSPVFYVCQQEKGAHPMWMPALHSFHCTETHLNCAFK